MKTVLGLVGGVALGAILGYVAAALMEPENFIADVVIGMPVGALIGAVVGGLIGYRAGKT
jgi:hypothetical protein